MPGTATLTSETRPGSPPRDEAPTPAVAEPRGKFIPQDLLYPGMEMCELVDGHLVEKEAGGVSSWVGGEILFHLWSAVATGVGWVLPSDASYACFGEHGERVRRPDVSLVLKGRLPGEELPLGHILLPPDLAVEVISPHDLYAQVMQKVAEYLRAGVRLVWIAVPDTREIEVRRLDGSVTLLRAEDELTGEDIAPGFRCRVGDLFPPRPALAEATVARGTEQP